jgi:hypothetical protein
MVAGGPDITGELQFADLCSRQESIDVIKGEMILWLEDKCCA